MLLLLLLLCCCAAAAAAAAESLEVGGQSAEVMAVSAALREQWKEARSTLQTSRNMLAALETEYKQSRECLGLLCSACCLLVSGFTVLQCCLLLAVVDNLYILCFVVQPSSA
jgi:hypothetical protein